MHPQPTTAELHRAIPHRGTGAPARTLSHESAILALLRERGPQGVLGSELYARPERFGRSPRNRVSELRQEGFLIEGRPHGSADWHYRLIRDTSGQEPRHIHHVGPASDFMRSRRAEESAAMPLFSPAVRP